MRGISVSSDLTFILSHIADATLVGRSISMDFNGLVNTEDTEHLIAILEIPLIASPTPGSTLTVSFSKKVGLNGLQTLDSTDLNATTMSGGLFVLMTDFIFADDFEGEQP